jgi:membrane-associated phospholipid phosphatase
MLRRVTGSWATSVPILVWLALLAGGVLVDVPVSNAIHAPQPARTATNGTGVETAMQSGGVRQPHRLAKRISRAPGHFGFTLLLAGVLTVRHPLRWRAGAFLGLCGIAGGTAGWLLKWVVGRMRPFHGVPPFEFHPFDRGLAGLFHNANLSFPSGDACLAFATAACAGVLFPRWRPAFYLAAAVVGMERVVENAHYVSDVVGGAAVVTLAVPLARRFWDRLVADANAPTTTMTATARSPGVAAALLRPRITPRAENPLQLHP